MPGNPRPEGYVFVCSNATESECWSRSLFGSPLNELAKMQRSITQTTQLFLFNFQSRKLAGPFMATGMPEQDIVPAAWGGKFRAQVTVAPFEDCREVKLKNRLGCGWKSAAQLDELRGCVDLPAAY